MPTIFIDGFKFRFYSSDLHEPPHMHVLKGEKEAKVWLQPIEVAYSRGYNTAELNRDMKLTDQNQDRLLEAWDEHFTR